MSVAHIRAENLSGESLGARIEELTARYPYLAEDPALADLILEDIAKAIRTDFAAGNEQAGEGRLVDVRRTLARFEHSPQRRLWVLEVFSAASYYYYLQGELGRARALLREGLRYAPEEVYLTHRLEMIGGCLFKMNYGIKTI